MFFSTATLAPHVPIAGTTTVSTFNGKEPAGPPFLDDLTALRAIDMFPSTHHIFLFNPKFRRECGMSSVKVGCAPLTHPSALRWMKAVSGSMKSGRISARNVELNCNFKELAPIRGNPSDEMDWPEAFIIA